MKHLKLKFLISLKIYLNKLKKGYLIVSLFYIQFINFKAEAHYHFMVLNVYHLEFVVIGMSIIKQ
ncbi:MAG: hypothetical protein ATN32_03220 [Candidatus Epulonipiscium fishelsonii]|nr:MAG: hypothetical protein ATN32_03220 [Epulopiscium sp. AS2M-Bin002]